MLLQQAMWLLWTVPDHTAIVRRPMIYGPSPGSILTGRCFLPFTASFCSAPVSLYSKRQNRRPISCCCRNCMIRRREAAIHNFYRPGCPFHSAKMTLQRADGLLAQNPQRFRPGGRAATSRTSSGHEKERRTEILERAAEYPQLGVSKA